MTKSQFPYSEEDTLLRKYLEDPEFYNEDVLVDHEDFTASEDVKIETVKEGLFDSAGLKKVTLEDPESGEKMSLMVKGYHPLRGWPKVRLAPYENVQQVGPVQQKNIDKVWESVPKAAKFEEEHMRVWNRAKAASPEFFARVERLVAVFEKYGNLGKTEMPLEFLVSRYIEGPTVDKDLLYLNGEMARITEAEHTYNISKFGVEGKQVDVKKLLEGLKKKKQGVLDAMLYTSSDLSTRVTHLMQEDPGFAHFRDNVRERGTKGYLLDRLSRHVRSYILWRALDERYRAEMWKLKDKNSRITLSDLHKRTKRRRVPRKLSKKLTEHVTKMRQVFDPLATELAAARQSYAQGDEYPHNFKLVPDPRSSKGEFRAAIFDPDKASVTVPEIAYAKVLGNNIAQLSPQDMLDYYDRALKQGKRIRAEMEDLRSGPLAEFIHNNERIFVLSCIYEMVNLLGTNADHHIDRHHSDRFTKLLMSDTFEGRRERYHNPLLFDEDEYVSKEPKLSTKLYEPSLANPYTASQLEGLFDYVLEEARWADDKLKRSTEKQRNFLKHIRVFEEKKK